MDLGATGVSEKVIGSLKCCLVEGDPQQLDGERQLRRRALLASIALESTMVAALVLLPLLGSERITYPHTIVPPYAPSQPLRPKAGKTAPPRVGKRACLVCFHQTLHPTSKTRGRVETTLEEPAVGDVPGLPTGPGVPGGLPLDSSRRVPAPPTKEPHLEDRKRVKVTSLEPALLAQVELHAIIRTDGTIQSLEVVSGNPLFYRSALAAVREWRYRPTILDGPAVEVDTHITVIYKLER